MVSRWLMSFSSWKKNRLWNEMINMCVFLLYVKQVKPKKKKKRHQGRCVYYSGVEKALITALINYRSVSKIITFLFPFFLRSQNPNNMQSIVSSYHLCLPPPPPVLRHRLICQSLPPIRLPSRRSPTSLRLFPCGRPHHFLFAFLFCFLQIIK